MPGIKKIYASYKKMIENISIKKNTKNNTINQKYMFRTLQKIKLI